MVSAGRLCLRFFANDEAASLARRGLSLVESLPDQERVCLTIDLEDVSLAAAPLSDWEAAATGYVALAEQALDLGAMSHARLGYYMASYVRWMHGSWSAAREEILQAERVSRGGSDEDQVIGMAEAARCLALLDRDLAQADAMLMEARALASRKRLVHHSIPSALGLLRFRENRLEEAEEFFQEARALAKQAGDRLTEFQANEHLVMLDLEQRRHAAAKARCAALIDIGTRLREGSEAPFAHALDAICDYALDDETPALEAAFAALRFVDAKQRLTYALLRAAMLDVERGRHERARTRASEALGYAQRLDRATDLVLAHAVLADASRGMHDRKAFASHARSLEGLERDSVADWAKRRADCALDAAEE
jgi:tetratricopeptide (TPR) repeat protein